MIFPRLYINPDLTVCYAFIVFKSKLINQFVVKKNPFSPFFFFKFFNPVVILIKTVESNSESFIHPGPTDRSVSKKKKKKRSTWQKIARKLILDRLDFGFDSPFIQKEQIMCTYCDPVCPRAKRFLSTPAFFILIDKPNPFLMSNFIVEPLLFQQYDKRSANELIERKFQLFRMI